MNCGTNLPVIRAPLVGLGHDVFLRERIGRGVSLGVLVVCKEPLSGFANCASHSRKEGGCVNDGRGWQEEIIPVNACTCLAVYGLLRQRGNPR